MTDPATIALSSGQLEAWRTDGYLILDEPLLSLAEVASLLKKADDIATGRHAGGFPDEHIILQPDGP